MNDVSEKPLARMFKVWTSVPLWLKFTIIVLVSLKAVLVVGLVSLSHFSTFNEKINSQTEIHAAKINYSHVLRYTLLDFQRNEADLKSKLAQDGAKDLEHYTLQTKEKINSSLTALRQLVSGEQQQILDEFEEQFVEYFAIKEHIVGLLRADEALRSTVAADSGNTYSLTSLRGSLEKGLAACKHPETPLSIIEQISCQSIVNESLGLIDRLQTAPKIGQLTSSQSEQIYFIHSIAGKMNALYLRLNDLHELWVKQDSASSLGSFIVPIREWLKHLVGATSHHTFSKSDADLSFYLEKAERLGSASEKLLAEIITANTNQLAEQQQYSIDTYEKVRHYLITISIISALIAAAISGLILLDIRIRVQRLIRVTNKVARGQLNVSCPISAHDEIGLLALEFNGMIRKMESFTGALDQAKHSAIEANKNKSEYLSHVSHEIRNPLSALHVASQALTQTNLDLKQHDLLRKIEICSQTLLRIVSDILDFSKIESGVIEVETAPFELKALIEETVSIFEPVASEKKIYLDTWVEPSLPIYLNGDAHRLKQVIVNLIANAIKFTDKGKIEVTVKPALVSQSPLPDHVGLKVTVLDTGIGMSQQEQEKVFQPFQQASTSTSRLYGGSGLGLAICKRLINVMGGEISCSSNSGQGSKFWFTLSLAAADITEFAEFSNPATDKNNEQNSSGAEKLKLKVLVVDDDEINLELNKLQLDQLGHDVTVVDSGKKAVNLLQNRSFDLVLMDCEMPDQDGWETTRLIRSSLKKTKDDLAIFALTAHAGEKQEKRCKTAGMNELMIKPLDLNEFISLSEQYFSANAKIENIASIDCPIVYGDRFDDARS